MLFYALVKRFFRFPTIIKLHFLINDIKLSMSRRKELLRCFQSNPMNKEVREL